VGVRRLGERPLEQGEEGCDLDMLGEDLVQPHLQIDYPDHDGALQKVEFLFLSSQFSLLF
jgi:hypothetical protein